MMMLSAAHAADIPRPVYKAPVSAPAPFSWSGCYLGGQVGWAWQRDRNTEFFNGAVSIFTPLEAADADGVKAGGLLGCNWQSGQFVFGIEADAEYADLDGHADFANSGTPPDAYDVRTDFQGSVRGRVGYAWDRNLIYVTGGVAWANISHIYFQNFPPTFQEIDRTRTGWTVGGGWEYAFTNNWIGRIEYRYADFGTITNVATIYAAGFSEEHETTEHAVRLAVSYKFGPWGP
jgi:outer membrane immunogenic protein